jgi:hypothetical protein
MISFNPFRVDRPLSFDTPDKIRGYSHLSSRKIGTGSSGYCTFLSTSYYKKETFDPLRVAITYSFYFITGFHPELLIFNCFAVRRTPI